LKARDFNIIDLAASKSGKGASEAHSS